jgi:hypothetical protein
VDILSEIQLGFWSHFELSGDGIHLAKIRFSTHGKPIVQLGLRPKSTRPTIREASSTETKPLD